MHQKISFIKDMDEKKYPILEEEDGVGMANEPAVGCVSAIANDTSLHYDFPNNYNGFYTEDADEFEQYKSELIAEAANDGPGFSWQEVRQQIKDRHPWLR